MIGHVTGATNLQTINSGDDGGLSVLLDSNPVDTKTTIGAPRMFLIFISYAGII